MQQYVCLVFSDDPQRLSTIVSYLKNLRSKAIENVHKFSFDVAKNMVTEGTLPTKGRRLFVLDMYLSRFSREVTKFINQIGREDTVFLISCNEQLARMLMAYRCSGDYQPRACVIDRLEIDPNEALAKKILLHIHRRNIRTALDEFNTGRGNLSTRLMNVMGAIEDGWQHIGGEDDEKTKKLVLEKFDVDETSDPMEVSLK